MAENRRPDFQTAATGENTSALTDNMIWAGNVLTIMLTEGQGRRGVALVDRADRVPQGFQCAGVLAVLKLSDAMTDPAEAAQEIKEQVSETIMLEIGNEQLAQEVSDFSVGQFSQFYQANKDRPLPQETVTGEQKSQLFTNLQKVPNTLIQAIDQDDIKMIISDSRSLKGLAPDQFKQSRGVYINGKIFLAEPYDPSTVTEEMAHYVDSKIGFSEKSGFSATIDPLVKDPDLMQVLGFIMNKRYYRDDNPNGYDVDNTSKMSAEALVDMYIIRNGFIKNSPLDKRSAEVLSLETKHPEKMSRIEGLQKFYEDVVKGKTPEDIEKFYEKQEEGIKIPGTDYKIPFIERLSVEDKFGKELALTVARIPESKMDSIFNNINNPEALLKAIYPENAIKKLDEFCAKAEEQYPKLPESKNTSELNPSFSPVS